MMSAKYFEYYTIILRGAVFSWTHCIVFIYLPVMKSWMVNISLWYWFTLLSWDKMVKGLFEASGRRRRSVILCPSSSDMQMTATAARHEANASRAVPLYLPAFITVSLQHLERQSQWDKACA